MRSIHLSRLKRFIQVQALYPGSGALSRFGSSISRFKNGGRNCSIGLIYGAIQPTRRLGRWGKIQTIERSEDVLSQILAGLLMLSEAEKFRSTKIRIAGCPPIPKLKALIVPAIPYSGYWFGFKLASAVTRPTYPFFTWEAL